MHHQICHITKLKLLATKWTMHVHIATAYECTYTTTLVANICI